jgi:hypothetical protein
MILIGESMQLRVLLENGRECNLQVITRVRIILELWTGSDAESKSGFSSDPNFETLTQHLVLTDIGAVRGGSIVHQCRTAPNFKVILTDRPLAFAIKPGQHHAVLTLQGSFHLGMNYVSLRDFDLCMEKLRKWTHNWVVANNNTRVGAWPTKTELDNSANVVKIFDSCLLWTDFLEEKHNKIPDSGVYMAKFGTEVRAWITAVDGKPGKGRRSPISGTISRQM